MPRINLPVADGRVAPFTLSEPIEFQTAKPGMALCRKALSAAHVVANPLADNSPFLDCSLDLAASVRYREYLWDLGLGVAEAMDTAQRGMGLSWASTQALIAETLRAASVRRDAIVYCGIGTDHIVEGGAGLNDVAAAYEEQLHFVQKHDGRVIVMASRELAYIARSPDDFIRTYDRILRQMDHPAILHWLGDMFDPALSGYWGYADPHAAMRVCIEIINRNARYIEGVKISLLDKNLEIEMRRQLPEGVRMYTGDDFNYPELIAGDEAGHSEALLGIFDAVAPAASAALLALTKGDRAAYDEKLEATVPLSRELFSAPTRFYKTGVVFLAYLNGHQDHFVMLGGHQGARSILHLTRIFRLADRAGLLRDPDMASERMADLLSLYGVSK